MAITDGLDFTELLERNDDSGTPKKIKLSLIDEDPNQPRKTFSEASLKELADSIKERGVKTPISVRETDDGRYTINYGARRFRASQLVGKDEIPAFIDNDYMPLDQIIENIQRENLSPLEIANFIDKLVKSGSEKQKVAKLLGKAPSYITYHLKLLSLSNPVAEILNNGRCQDITVLNQIEKLYKQDPEETKQWIKDPDSEFTRSSVASFKNFLDEKKDGLSPANSKEKNQPEQTDSFSDYQDGGKGYSDFDPDDVSDDGQDSEKTSKGKNTPEKDEKANTAPKKTKKMFVNVQFKDKTTSGKTNTITGVLSLEKHPTRYGLIWIVLDDSDGIDIEVEASDVKILGVSERTL